MAKKNDGIGKFWIFLRLAMGWTFLWAFLDKLFGLGFSTAADKSWLAGVSPTTGFLEFAAKGPFASIYQSLAGNVLIDIMFMAGLLFIGLTMLLGVMTRLGAYSGIALVLLMFSALLLPKNNPLMDEHIIYAIIFWGISMSETQWLFGKRWAKTKFAKKYPVLR